MPSGDNLSICRAVLRACVASLHLYQTMFGSVVIGVSFLKCLFLGGGLTRFLGINNENNLPPARLLRFGAECMDL